MDLVPLKDCVKGRVYRLRCRNLAFGVFDGKDGFIGIRTKFGDRFLFTEYHWEQGAPFGTVNGAVDLGIDVPAGIEIVEMLGTIDSSNGRPMVLDETIPNPNLAADYRGPSKMGWWRYTDTGEVAPSAKDGGAHAMGVANRTLFVFLEQIEKEHGTPPEKWR